MFCPESVKREKLTQFLEQQGIGTGLVFAGNLTKQPAYQGVDFRISGSLDTTDHIMTKAFWIGVHPALTSEQIDYMLDRLEVGVKHASL